MSQAGPKKAEIYLEYMPYIDHAPRRREEMWAQACASDTITVNSWRDIWIRQIRENHKRFGSFGEHGIGKFWASARNLPCVVAGSGPSLVENGALLKDRPAGMPLISALHNFHFFMEHDVPVDYWVTLDAGPVTIEEVSEGGKESADWYWEKTKGQKLFAYVGSPPELLQKWQGEIYFFNCPVPCKDTRAALEELETFHTYVSTGGNVLGASAYIAKAILGANPLIFVGANFSFSYSSKFHGWDSKYDREIGSVMRVKDVYGNSVKTWPSYWNFKNFFDWMAVTIPGLYINCTEGGCFGAYADGNIRDILQMPLEHCMKMYRLVDMTKESCENPATPTEFIVY